MSPRKNASASVKNQGFLIKYQAIVAGLITCLVSLLLWFFNHTDTKNSNSNSINVAVLRDFETAKNKLDLSIKSCINYGYLTKKEEDDRISSRLALVTTAMTSSKFIPSDSLLHIALFTRFDDTQTYRNLCAIPREKLTQLLLQNTLIATRVRRDFL